MENMNITNTDAQKATFALAMGVSVAEWEELQIALTAIRATVGELDSAMTSADVAANIAAKAISDRNAHWDDPDADRAVLADTAKKAADAVASAQAAAADKKALLDWQCKEWDEKSMEARLAYIADNGIAEWIRLPKVYKVGVKTVKAGDETARIAYTHRVDLPLSQLPRDPIVDRMVCAIRADIRAQLEALIKINYPTSVTEAPSNRIPEVNVTLLRAIHTGEEAIISKEDSNAKMD